MITSVPSSWYLYTAPEPFVPGNDNDIFVPDNIEEGQERDFFRLQ
jgi:hypothetical protein